MLTLIVALEFLVHGRIRDVHLLYIDASYYFKEALCVGRTFRGIFRLRCLVDRVDFARQPMSKVSKS